MTARLFSDLLADFSLVVEAIEANAVRHEGCLIWQGGSHNGGRNPIMFVRGHGHVSLRKLMVESRSKKEMPPKMRAVTTCGSRLCVEPEHVVARLHSRIMVLANEASNYVNHPARIVKLQNAERRKSSLTIEDARAIRASEESMAVLAKRYGKSYALIGQIRRNEKWRDITGNPFAALAA